MTRTILFVAGLLLVSSFASVASAASSRNGGPTYNERYGVLSERNIFLKDRSHPTSRPSASSQPTRNTDPEHSLALTGIVFEDNSFHAYVENSTGTVTRLSVGDSVARGKVTEIELEGIAYQSTAAAATSQPTWIAIGDDFTGQPATILATASAFSPEPSTMPSGIEGLNANDPSLTIEQRLKLRRMQELKGK